MKSYYNLFLVIVLVIASCNSSTQKNYQEVESIPSTTDSVSKTQEKVQTESLDDRYSITGDFNGDKVEDTIFESYISALTNRETPKTLDGDDYDNNVELITKNKPISKLYCNISMVDTFVVTKESQQAGISFFRNLGDVNGDGSDELGYYINWVDYSNLNTYQILTIRNNKFEEIFNFNLNEMEILDSTNLIDDSLLVKCISPKTIIYKYYSDSATVELGQHTFE